jgi:DNA-3-methyladenine glycosylase
MQRNRPGVALRNLARGPGRLCAALGLSSELSGLPIATDGMLTIGKGMPALSIEATPRIGITRNKEPLWRYTVEGNTFVSLRRNWRTG